MFSFLPKRCTFRPEIKPSNAWFLNVWAEEDAAVSKDTWHRITKYLSNLGIRVEEAPPIKGAPHNCLMTHPEEVVDLIIAKLVNEGIYPAS